MPENPAHRLIWLLIWQLLSRGNCFASGHCSPNVSRPSSSEQGLTILECLVAVMLIVITIAMVAPPLVLATATRVQNRRTEQALQVAQGEIDRIRTAVAMGTHAPANLPAIAPNTTSNNLSSVAAPNSVDPRLRSLNPSASCPTRFDPTTDRADSIAVNRVLPVDVDGDCIPDYLVQIFRTPGLVSNAERATGMLGLPSEFDVGVRVYPVLAASNFAPGVALGSLTLSGLETAPAPLQLTNSTQRRRPLAVLYSKFVWAEQQTSLCSYFPETARRAIASCSTVFPNGSP